MFLVYILTPFQWSIITFLFGLVVGIVKISIWVTTAISLIKNDISENNKRDEETRKEIEEIKKEERANYKEVTKSLSKIIQGLVRVEEKMSHVEKQLDKN